MPENRIYIRSVTTTSIKVAWPETTDIRASSYLIYVWRVSQKEPMPYEHLYQGTDRRHAVATRTISDLIPGEIYNIRIVITGTSSSVYTQQRTRKRMLSVTRDLIWNILRVTEESPPYPYTSHSTIVLFHIVVSMRYLFSFLRRMHFLSEISSILILYYKSKRYSALNGLIAVPSPPLSVQSDAVTRRSTSFILKWTRGLGTFQRYHVVVRDASSSEVMLDRQLDRSHSMVMVTGLEPDTKYACAITTLSGGVRGHQESNVVSVNVRTGEL